jgi:peptidyl-prolyl cis-trans isomerase C
MITQPDRRLDPAGCQVPPREAKTARLLAVVFLAALAGAGHAADAPKAAPPAAAPRSDLSILPAPAQTLAIMANNLDKDADFVVATVAGQPITKGDVADTIRAMPVSLASLGYKALYIRAMDTLLRRELAAASARKAGVDKDPVVRRREKSAADQVLAEAWVDRQAATAAGEASPRARYERDIAGKPGPEEVRARVILVPTEAQARELIGQIQAGADFGDLARQHSQDLSAADGGDIGFVPLDALSAEAGAAMFALAPGQVTGYPVRALPGYFILRIEGRRQRATPAFEEARPALANAARREAAAAALNALTAEIRIKGTDEPAAPVSQSNAARPARQ